MYASKSYSSKCNGFTSPIDLPVQTTIFIPFSFNFFKSSISLLGTPLSPNSKVPSISKNITFIMGLLYKIEI